MVSKVASAHPLSNLFCVQPPPPPVSKQFVCGTENLTTMVFTLFMLLVHFDRHVCADILDVLNILRYMVNANVLCKH